MEVRGPAGVVRIPPGRQQVILALLLMEAGQVVSTEQLVDTLWEERPPDTARTQVHICVSRLRKSLADASVTAPIDTRAPGYQLRVAREDVDMYAFTAQVKAARVLVKEGRAADAAAQLRAAVALWRGPCLNGIPNRVLRTRALRLDEDRLNAVEDYLELEIGLGRHHELVGEITRLVHENPLRERSRGLLMQALHRSGRQAEALETYRSARELLIDELGLEPGASLRALERAILSGTGADQPARPAEAPAAEPVAAKPRQLPADTADFVGDERLVAAAESVLTGGSGRAVGVVVVVGRPGVGKTAFAAHVGHRVAMEHFPDGQLYCELRGTRGGPTAAAELLGRFLISLGIPGPMIPAGLSERVEMYRTLLADRRVLVVLDDAVTESQVLPLLPGSNTCAVLVTSRSRLTGVPGARQVELDSLDPARSLELLGLVLGQARVDREPEAAAALVRTVGGLPLALRIIGARLAARPHWTLASMVSRLASERRRLDELAHGEMTIRASLSLTHDGMDRSSRELFGLLALADGASLPGWVAGAVLDDDCPYPSDLLEPLVDVQMLDVVAVERTGEFRYHFQDIVRLFAREKAAAGIAPAERAAATARMLGGWLALAEQAHRRVYGGDYTVVHGSAPRWSPPSEYVDELLADPLEWMDGEQANLCGAVQQAADAGLHELCWDLAVTAVTLFEARGYLDDWERTHLRALAAAKTGRDRLGVAAVLGSLGTLHINSGQTRKSSAALTEALDMFLDLDDPRGLGLCRRDLGLLARRAGDDDSARRLYEEAMADFDRAGDVVGRAIVLTQRAEVLGRHGEAARARADLAEAMDIYQQTGYEGGMPHTLRRMGQIQAGEGELHAAAATYRQVLELVRRRRDVIGEGHLLRNLGEVSLSLGEHETAVDCFERSLALREQMLDHGGAAAVRVDLAEVHLRRGDHAKAVDLLTHAAGVYADRGMERERARVERTLVQAGEGTGGD
ncbi:BTAD domain-containing putative transcriptional regulator [Actinokineospora guangxiensis]|uniref:BTAD domain-containing putative transcriptional regulator n=1 Tax=Actinokineospora guangxiensis TaxID=1490288 RepID=A0ABW0EHW2_9PSEU